MKTIDFISRIKGETRVDPQRFQRLRESLPLGEYADGEYVLSHRIPEIERYHHTCVTGALRAEFISRLLLTLSGLYEKSEAVFFIVSPNLSYGRLMQLSDSDFIIPFLTSAQDLPPILEAVRSLAAMRQGKRTGAKTFLVLDGLESLEPEEKRSSLECYRPFFEAVGTTGIEVITGVDLARTIFAGYPSTFVGIGNCLVTPSVGGGMDVTYVGIDGSVALPKKCQYPSLPSIEECIELRNAKQ